MSIWCWDCKHYLGEGSCMEGQNTEENHGVCIWEEPKEDDDEDYYGSLEFEDDED